MEWRVPFHLWGLAEPDRRPVLCNAHLVAEWEWRGLGANYDDFEKLLLARASSRVLIFDGDHFNLADGSSEEFAGRLAARVNEFEHYLDEDARLLVSWETIGSKNPNEWWRFRYFTIEESGLQEL